MRRVRGPPRRGKSLEIIGENNAPAKVLLIGDGVGPVFTLGTDKGGPYFDSIKSALGKLDADPDEVLAGVEPAGFNHLPIVGGHAAKVKELLPIHKDPFDRLLVAQARFEPMILLTDDEVFSASEERLRRRGTPKIRHPPSGGHSPRGSP